MTASDVPVGPALTGAGPAPDPAGRPEVGVREHRATTGPGSPTVTGRDRQNVHVRAGDRSRGARNAAVTPAAVPNGAGPVAKPAAVSDDRATTGPRDAIAPAGPNPSPPTAMRRWRR